MSGLVIASGTAWHVETRWEPKRCIKRDPDGHRCTQKHEHTGTHRAFGKVWQ